MSTISDFIENKDLVINQTDYYAAILGESPSKGARSPALWNVAFKGFHTSGLMHPMDIKTERLGILVEYLKKDPRFIGGAVTMPHKIDIIPYLDDIEPEARLIGAINCIYREKKKLIGANTDGAGAIYCLKREIGESLEGKTALIVGTGGAGYSVATYLARSLGPKGRLKLANRSYSVLARLMKKLERTCEIKNIEWPIAADQVKDIEILINCSSIGFETFKNDEKGYYSLKFYSPLGPVNDNIRLKDFNDGERMFFKDASDSIRKNIDHSLKILGSMKNPVIFDIIYQPRMTVLLFLSKIAGYRVLNGEPMNMEQAVIAFYKAVTPLKLADMSQDKIRTFMSHTSDKS